MDKMEFAAEARSEVGTAASRRLRRSGRLPANLYGHGEDPVSLHVDAREFDKALRNNVRVVGLGLSGNNESAVVHDVDYDPVSQEVLHVDFLRVSMTEKVEVQVPVKLHGPAKGEATGGILLAEHDSVLVRCTPMAIPEEIELDVRQMEIGDSLHASDLTWPQGVEFVGEPHAIVASIMEPREPEEEPAEAEVEDEEAQEPEVIGKKPDDEEEPETPES